MSGIAGTKPVTHQSVRLAFGSVTATTAGGANTLLTLTRCATILSVYNSLNQDVWITKNGVNWVPLPAGQSFCEDLHANANRHIVGDVFGVYRAASAPTSGMIGMKVEAHT